MADNGAGMKQKASNSPSFLSKIEAFLSRLKADPYGALDSLEVKGHGYRFNTSRIEAGLRKAFFNIEYVNFGKRRIPVPNGLIVFAAILWALQGWDSSPHQIINFMNGLPDYLTGKITWSTLAGYYLDAYGKFEHYSAFVIYATLYYAVSLRLNKVGVTRLRNVLMTTGLVALPIGAFEVFWNVSYYFFQGQTWILALQMPQLKIILQNDIAMPLIGVLVLVFLVDWRAYRVEPDWRTFICLFATMLLILLWWGYGNVLPVQQISVQVQGYGTWVSSRMFPQTVYTVDTNILDNMALGEQFWIQNDLLHLVNTITKVFLTLTAYFMLKIERR